MNTRNPPMGRWPGGIAAAALGLLLGGCGGGDDPQAASASYSVNVTVGGLAGSGLVLQDNGGDDRTVAGNGSVSFATALKTGTAYSVSVKTQPSGPSQTCSLAGASGHRRRQRRAG